MKVKSFNCFSSDFAEWLTHNSGEEFDVAGTAPLVKHCVWNAASDPSETIANDSLVTDFIGALFTAKRTQEIAPTMATDPEGTERE